MIISNGSELNYDKESVSAPKGQREIACYSWTTAKGVVTPLMFKLMDEGGEIHTFDRIQVNFSEQKLFCGIPAYEYNCDVTVNGLVVNLTLQYFPERCKWYLSEI
jgi:hypothetical protein